MSTLRKYSRQFGLRNLIETGTYLGLTVEALRNDFTCIVSIELDSALYSLACTRFAGARNVKLLWGDSSLLMEFGLRFVGGPALCWLDAHFSGGFTAQGATETPVWAELDAILTDHSRNHVILIDDARSFERSPYPSVEQVARFVRERRPGWVTLVDHDIIRIHAPFSNASRVP